jgi:hypothetical protein
MAMSRFTRALPQPGTAITAAALNLDFAQFEVASVGNGPIDQTNLREAAVDLPTLDLGDAFVLQTLESETLANPEGFHVQYFEVPSTTAGPATLRPIENIGAVETNLDLGTSGATVSPGDVLRVYWHLSCKSEWSVSDPVAPGGPGSTSPYTDEFNNTGRFDTSDWCWVIHLQWDITSNALTDWEEVPEQGDFQGTSPLAAGSCYLSALSAASVVEAFSLFRDNVSYEVVQRGWRPATGAFYYQPDGSVTVYGLRLVVHGIYKPYKVASGGDTLNALVLDEAVAHADTKLLINHGRLTVAILKGE